MKKYTTQELAGKTLFVTSQYSLNIPFKISAQYLHDGELFVDTWEGRNATTKKPMGRVKNEIYTIEGINNLIKNNSISFTKTKKP